jgi:acetylglutamate kinase
MQKLIEKADVLIEALPYIQKFRGETVVVKLGGSAQEDKQHVEGILEDVTFMECVGMRAIVIHGGGKAISRKMKERGIEPRFVKGLRVTCEQSIKVVEQVLNEEINPELVGVLRRFGAPAQGLRGEDVLKVVRKSETDEQTGEVLDWGFVGEPGEVDTKPIEELLRQRVVPVITPLGRGADGMVHNVNADSAAGAIAGALKARKLAYVTDVPGLLRNPEDPESIMSTLRISEVEDLIAHGVISGGMLPKVQSGVEALRAGVRKIHVIDGRMPHSLLLEIFTDKGVGTEIIWDE